MLQPLMLPDRPRPNQHSFSWRGDGFRPFKLGRFVPISWVPRLQRIVRPKPSERFLFVNLRLKGNGIFWTVESAEAVLQLRAQLLSGRWDQFLREILRPVDHWEAA